MKEKIVVIGTEKEAEAFLYQNSDKFEVVLFVDKKPRRNCFRGISVITLDSIVAMRKDIYCKIVLAMNKDEYMEIAKTLTKYGLEEFVDFFYYKALDKKVALLWGNCHIMDLANYLEQLPAFNSEYWIYPQVGVQEYNCQYLGESFCKSIDLYIYQDVGVKTNGMLYSSEGLLKRLSQSAVKIKLPNLFRKGFAFFPQASYKAISAMRESEYIFVMYTDNQDKIISEKKQSGFSAEQIALEIENSEIFEKEQIILGFEYMFQIIDEMDMTCDVKISKWIKKHYRNEMIFIDPGHVSKAVYVEYMKQILTILGLYEMEKQNVEKVICAQPSVLLMPIYGCVRDAMELAWTDEANNFIKKGTYVLKEGGG